MIATIAVIAAIAEKKKLQRSQRSYNHSPAIAAIAATTIAEIQKVLSRRSLSLRLLESGFHMIAELFFLSEYGNRAQPIAITIHRSSSTATCTPCKHIERTLLSSDYF